jgi:uncharacterized membrane protein
MNPGWIHQPMWRKLAGAGPNTARFTEERHMTNATLGRLTTVIEWASVVGCALMAGVFFAFSSLVMPALARLPAAQGIAAMQAINRVALFKPFLLTFAGTAAACAALALLSLGSWAEPKVQRRIAGCALYLVGTFLVTAAIHVPRNEALERVDAAAGQAATLWLTYLSEWTAWNHVRAGAALLALLLILLSR